MNPSLASVDAPDAMDGPKERKEDPYSVPWLSFGNVHFWSSSEALDFDEVTLVPLVSLGVSGIFGIRPNVRVWTVAEEIKLLLDQRLGIASQMDASEHLVVERTPEPVV